MESSNIPASNDTALMHKGNEEESKESNSNQMYKGYLIFEKDNESFEKMLSELCPVAA